MTGQKRLVPRSLRGRCGLWALWALLLLSSLLCRSLSLSLSPSLSRFFSFVDLRAIERKGRAEEPNNPNLLGRKRVNYGVTETRKLGSHVGSTVTYRFTVRNGRTGFLTSHMYGVHIHTYTYVHTQQQQQ